MFNGYTDTYQENCLAGFLSWVLSKLSFLVGKFPSFSMHHANSKMPTHLAITFISEAFYA